MWLVNIKSIYRIYYLKKIGVRKNDLFTFPLRKYDEIILHQERSFQHAIHLEKKIQYQLKTNNFLRSDIKVSHNEIKS